MHGQLLTGMVRNTDTAYSSTKQHGISHVTWQPEVQMPRSRKLATSDARSRFWADDDSGSPDAAVLAAFVPLMAAAVSAVAAAGCCCVWSCCSSCDGRYRLHRVK